MNGDALLCRFNLKLMAGDMSVSEGACRFRTVMRSGFLDLFNFFNFLELMDEVEVLCGGDSLRCEIGCGRWWWLCTC